MQWLSDFEPSCKSKNIAVATALVDDDCYWRDLVSFTWNIKTMERKPQIAEMLKATWGNVRLSNWKSEGEASLIAKLVRHSYFICDSIEGQYLRDVQCSWKQMRSTAGIADVHFHDLRYTFTSCAEVIGNGQPIIGKLDGHIQTQTLASCAPLASNHWLARADQVSKSPAGALWQMGLTI